jgi:hypothetical protein
MPSHPEEVPLGCNDPLYDDQTVTLQQAAGNYQVKNFRTFRLVFLFTLCVFAVRNGPSLLEKQLDL